MNRKYILRFDNRKIAIKYNTEKEILFVGGAKGQDKQIIDVIDVYFGDPKKTIKMIPSNGKIRYSMILTDDDFQEAINELKTNLWIYEAETLLRIMR